LYWIDATFFVPQDQTSDGSNHSLTQVKLDQMLKQGVEFWLDQHRDQLWGDLKAPIRTVDPVEGPQGTMSRADDSDSRRATHQDLQADESRLWNEFGVTPGPVSPLTARVLEWIGLHLTRITKDRFREKNVFAKYTGGLDVTFVRSHGPAEKAGIHEVDIVVGLQGRQISSLQELDTAMREAAEQIVGPYAPSLRFDVLRNGVTVRVDVPFPVSAINQQSPDGSIDSNAPTQATKPPPDSTTQPKDARHFKTHAGVSAIAYSSDGNRIAFGARARSLNLPANGASRAEVHWNPSVNILDPATGQVLVSLELTTDEEDAVLAATDRVSDVEVTALASSPDGNVVAVGTSIGQVKLMNIQTRELVQALDDEQARLADKETPEDWASLQRAMGSVASLAFSPDGSLLAVCGQSFEDFSDVFDGIRRLGRSVTGPGRLKV
jgi:hypothetical protein